MATQTRQATFQGWRVVCAAFVLAVFGWGLGFYGPPIFLKVLHEQRGWPIGLIATAVTVHFLVGAYSGANPLWVAAIAGLGFAHAALAIAATMLLALWILAGKYFAQTPETEQMGLSPDGEAKGEALGFITSA